VLKQLKIRNATPSDVDLIFDWANDELVRKQSFTSADIDYDTHREWFSNKLEDENSLIFIIEAQEIPASIVRFEIGDRSATIGVSIAKEFRGKGFAVTTINMGVDAYFNSYNLTILASIKPENIASIKSFKKAGFEFLKEEKINGIESVTYQLTKP